MKLLAASLLTLAMPIVAQAEIIVSDPWARASVLASRPGAVYLTLTGGEPDRLLEVTSPAAGHVMLHGVETDAAGVTRMVLEPKAATTEFLVADERRPGAYQERR